MVVTYSLMLCILDREFNPTRYQLDAPETMLSLFGRAVYNSNVQGAQLYMEEIYAAERALAPTLIPP